MHIKNGINNALYLKEVMLQNRQLAHFSSLTTPTLEYTTKEWPLFKHVRNKIVQEKGKNIPM